MKQTHSSIPPCQWDGAFQWQWPLPHLNKGNRTPSFYFYLKSKKKLIQTGYGFEILKKYFSEWIVHVVDFLFLLKVNTLSELVLLKQQYQGDITTVYEVEALRAKWKSNSKHY